GSLNYLFSVAAVSADDVWAVGTYDANPGHTLVERWDGAEWNVFPSPSSGDDLLIGVSAVSASDAWAVGYHSDSHQTLSEHWDGTQWSIIPSPNVITASASYLYKVAGVATNDVWAVGYYCCSGPPDN